LEQYYFKLSIGKILFWTKHWKNTLNKLLKDTISVLPPMLSAVVHTAVVHMAVVHMAVSLESKLLSGIAYLLSKFYIGMNSIVIFRWKKAWKEFSGQSSHLFHLSYQCINIPFSIVDSYSSCGKPLLPTLHLVHVYKLWD
jgi:hypothetical protein